MFSNAFLTYVEQDPIKLETNKKDTYAQWVGLNTAPPVRILNKFSGKVEPQTTGNFLLSNDGLSNYYDTDPNGNTTNLYVDDALAINTGKIINKMPTLDTINQDKTGWVNASNSGGTIWLPQVAATKYNETLNNTYKDMSVWGKRTFLIDSLNPPPAVVNAQVSSDDDAYLYVNGYNVRSSSYNVHGPGASPIGGSPFDYFKMVDTSDYVQDEYVMVNGVIGKVNFNVGGGPAPAAGEIKIEWNQALTPEEIISFQNISVFDDLAINGKKPATVYHVEQAKDASGSDIKVNVAASVGATELTLTSTQNIYPGQIIYVNNQPIVVQSVQPPDAFGVPRTGVITFSTCTT